MCSFHTIKLGIFSKDSLFRRDKRNILIINTDSQTKIYPYRHFWSLSCELLFTEKINFFVQTIQYLSKELGSGPKIKFLSKESSAFQNSHMFFKTVKFSFLTVKFSFQTNILVQTIKCLSE